MLHNTFMPAPGSVPFRNGFRSFLTALQFGLTLGGGGSDSADCEFSIEHVRTFEDEDSLVTAHNVDGMDVQFCILAFYTKENVRMAGEGGDAFETCEQKLVGFYVGEFRR